MNPFPHLKSQSAFGRAKKGFTLVELLAVMAIMAILTSVLVSSMSGLQTSEGVTNAAYTIQGILDRARALATSQNTYTWVGFFEENPNSAGTAGTGQLVVCTVSSADGSELYSVANPPTSLDTTKLVQPYKLQKIPNVHLDVLTQAQVPRTIVPADPYQMGDNAFANGIRIPYPLTGTPTYNFLDVIQFNPQGDATRIGDYPTPLMEIGLRPAHGTAVSENSKDLLALQITGIGGKTTMYRP